MLALPDPVGQAAGTPRALVVERDGRAVAAAALSVVRERGLATVRHLGDACNWFDPEPPAFDAAAREALADALVEQPGDVLELEEMAHDGELARALLSRCPGAVVIPGPPTYHVDVRTARARARDRRREAGRLARRAADLGTPLRIERLSDWAAIEPRLDEALTLQARAWQGRAADPFTGTAPGRDYVRAAIAAMGRERRVRLVRLEVGGRLAAFHLAVAWGTRAVVYKTAFDRDLTGLPGLGWASLLATVDRLAAEGVRTIDLGPWGDYKGHIAQTRRTVTVRVGLSRAGRAYLAAVTARRAARAVLRGRSDRRVRSHHPGGDAGGGFV